MNCQQTQELLEEYVLGLLDPETQKQVEEHLAGCPDCRTLAASYQETLATLPEALAHVSPTPLPEHLRDKVISRIVSRSDVLPRAGVLNASNDSTPLISTQPADVSTRNWVFPMSPTRVALIVSCLLLVIALLWSIRLNVVLARERALRAEFSELVGQQELVLEIVDSSHTVRRVLLPPLGDSRAYGKVFTRDDMPHVVAMAARLTPPAPGQAYHLWLTRDDETFLAGTLRTNDAGFGLATYDDSVNGPHYSRAMVTLQSIGSTIPVQSPVLEWVAEE